jgi:hypothetical protein
MSAVFDLWPSGSSHAALSSEDRWQFLQAKAAIGLIDALFLSASNPVRSAIHPQFSSLQATWNRN